MLPLSFYVSIPEFFPGQRTAPRFVACEVILVGRDRCKDKIELQVCRAHCCREDNDHLLQVVRPEQLALCFKAACLTPLVQTQNFCVQTKPKEAEQL